MLKINNVALQIKSRNNFTAMFFLKTWRREKMATIKITVLKRCLVEDLVNEYAADKSKLVLCAKFKEGQEFMLDGANIPPNFCSWAFADIQRDIVAMLHGANYPWMKQKGTIISCCTDGLRPVFFKIERID